MPREENWPSVVNTISVEDLAATVDAAEANGGTVIERRIVIPGVGYLAYCRDTEGNFFGAMQGDTSAQMG